MTTLLYLQDPLAMSCEATLLDIAEADTETVIVLDQTPFYPRGGGQASDTGWIRGAEGEMEVRVASLADDGRVLHVGNVQGRLSGGERVLLEVNRPARRLNSRLHTGGEVLCAAVSRLGKNWHVTAACHIPGQSRVAFASDLAPDQLNAFTQALVAEVQAIVAADYAVETFLDVPVEEAARLCPLDADSLETKKGGLRLVSPVPGFYRPCLGAHLLRTGEIGGVRFRKARLRGREISISYEVEQAGDV